MRSSNILIPYVKGLADGADMRMHIEAGLAKTPSVEPDVGMFLEFFTYSVKPAKILEIGCGIGVSTRYMAKGAPDAHITAVDYNAGRLEHARDACRNMNVNCIFADGEEYLRDDRGVYDVIFVDSVKKRYPVMLHYSLNRLKEGGAVIFDDVFLYGEIFKQDCEIAPKYIGAARVLREFLNNVKAQYRHTLLPIGGGLLMVGK